MDGVKSGGGDYPWIFDHAVHFFAAAEFFMLDQKINEVYSVTGTCQRRRRTEGGSPEASYAVPEVDVPIISWTFENSDCQGVWMRSEPLNGKFDFMNGFSTQIIGETGMIEVLGEGGHNLIWEGQQQHLVLHRDGKETQCFRFEEGGDDMWDSEISYYGQGHMNQVHHLIDCILEDRTPNYGGEEGTHAVRCTLAAIRSAQEGRPVQVQEIGEAFTAYGG